MLKQITKTGFISAFPGTGKSSIHGNAPENGLYPVRADGSALYRMVRVNRPFVYDSDSSTFDKEYFPQNYIAHMKSVIQRHAGDAEFVFLGSSHDNVRDAMNENGIHYTLVYPDRSLKNEYIERYKKRGSPEPFIKLMENKWDDFIDSCERDANEKIILKSGQYLSDVL